MLETLPATGQEREGSNSIRTISPPRPARTVDDDQVFLHLAGDAGRRRRRADRASPVSHTSHVLHLVLPASRLNPPFRLRGGRCCSGRNTLKPSGGGTNPSFNRSFQAPSSHLAERAKPAKRLEKSSLITPLLIQFSPSSTPLYVEKEPIAFTKQHSNRGLYPSGKGRHTQHLLWHHNALQLVKVRPSCSPSLLPAV